MCSFAESGLLLRPYRHLEACGTTETRSLTQCANFWRLFRVPMDRSSSMGWFAQALVSRVPIRCRVYAGVLSASRKHRAFPKHSLVQTFFDAVLIRKVLPLLGYIIETRLPSR